MLSVIYQFIIDLLQALFALLKAPFQSHPCKQCNCEHYSDEALFIWMHERKAHTTYPDEMLSAGIIDRPLKCSLCEHPRQMHGTLQTKILTCEHMPDGGRVFMEQRRRQTQQRRERRFPTAANDRVRERRPSVEINVVTEGEGLPAKGGDVIVCHYDAYVNSTMERFETSRSDAPFRFTVGAAQSIPGWEMGLKEVKKGERRKIVVPPQLAYRGREICGERNVTVLFDVEVHNIEVC